MLAKKQRQKQGRVGGTTGKGFVPGDPRINRTRPGPGRPSLAYREALAALEPDALHVMGEALRSNHWSTRLAAAKDVLDRLHGKPGQQQVANGTFTLADLLPLARLAEIEQDSVFVIGGDKQNYVEGATSTE